MIGDYNLLSAQGNLAYYDSVEITTVYFHNTRTGKIVNVYTLVCFEESTPTSTPQTLHLDNNFHENLQLGLIQHNENLSGIGDKFSRLVNDSKWEYNGKELEFPPEISKIGKTFIPPNLSTVNKVLKNNFHNGSYILEFFATQKGDLDFLLKPENVKLLNRLSEKVKKHLPIDLSLVRDRLGNVIFQFPVSLISVREVSLPTWGGVALTLELHRKCVAPPILRILKASELDYTIPGFASEDVSKDGTFSIVMGSSEGGQYTVIYNPSSKLILHVLKSAFIKYTDFEMNIQDQTPRTFNDRADVVTLFSSPNRGVVRQMDHHNWIRERIYDEERVKLKNELSFIQYADKRFADKSEKTAEKEKALNDIRILIKRYGKKGVSLIDPYVSSSDIINTLFYSECIGASLRVIGSSKVYENLYKTPALKHPFIDSLLIRLGIKKVAITISDREKWVAETRNNLSNAGNNRGLNLEFRYKWGQNGWPFHDRFIIFHSADGAKPRVWSLGISVNQLGAEHHILQEIKNAQNILDAFEDLWESLATPECLAYKC